MRTSASFRIIVRSSCAISCSASLKTVIFITVNNAKINNAITIVADPDPAGSDQIVRILIGQKML